MSSVKVKARLPVVGETIRACGTLVEIQDVTPPHVKVLDYIFQQICFKTELRVNGKQISVGPTYNDFYGVESGRKAAIRDIQRELLSLGPTSDIEAVVIQVISYVRKRPCERGEVNFYANEIRDMKTLSAGSRWDVPPDIEEVVWSSNQSEET